MTRLRYFIITLMTLEPGVIGGMSSKTQYFGLSLDRFICVDDINKLIKDNPGKTILSAAPIGASFMEVTAVDYKAFLNRRKKRQRQQYDAGNRDKEENLLARVGKERGGMSFRTW